MLSFGKSSWSQYYNSFLSGFPCYHEHRLTAIQPWQVPGVGNLGGFLLFTLEMKSFSASQPELSVPSQSPLRPGALLMLATPELEYGTSGTPKRLHPPWLMGLKEAPARGEPGGEQGAPASPSEVALGAVGLCPWNGGRCDWIMPPSPPLEMSWRISVTPELIGTN